MNNKLKKLSRGFVCLSFLIGSSIVVLIPVKAISNTDIEHIKYDSIIKTEIQPINKANIYRDKVSLCIKEAEVNLNNNNISGAENNINIALDYLEKFPNNLINDKLNEKIDTLINSINKYKANNYLKEAVINLGNNNINKAEDYLLKAFNYGNQITKSNIREPIVSMIIRIQNQISISNTK